MKIKKLIGLLAIMCSILLTSCGVGPVVKELKKINDNDSRYWAEFVKKNGINAIDYEDDTVLQYALENYNPSLIKACVKCGATYHVKYNAPKTEGVCDNCGSELIQREDDKPETVLNRLSVYHEQTQPLIDYYEGKGIVKNIDGTKDLNDVFADIVAVLS